jgi:hypothetical protein
MVVVTPGKTTPPRNGTMGSDLDMVFSVMYLLRLIDQWTVDSEQLAVNG